MLEPQRIRRSKHAKNSEEYNNQPFYVHAGRKVTAKGRVSSVPLRENLQRVVYTLLWARS
jgi:hypothetical protein